MSVCTIEEPTFYVFFLQIWSLLSIKMIINLFIATRLETVYKPVNTYYIFSYKINIVQSHYF